MTRTIGFFLGIALFVLFLALPTLETFTRVAQDIVQANQVPVTPAALASSMQKVVALLLLMVCWWLTEAVPLPATALLPGVLLPVLKVSGTSGAAEYVFDPKHALMNYASPVIFLFLGGFLIAGAMQKWKLDRRFTLWFLTLGNMAGNPRTILLGIMVATAFMSMWISNTATTAMMLPLGLGVLSLLKSDLGGKRFRTALMLGIAWAASIGGVATIIGSPPNGIALGILESRFRDDPAYHHLTFLDWMKFGIPYVILFLPVAWGLLVLRYVPGSLRITEGKGMLTEQRRLLGPLSIGARNTIAVFLCAVILWVTNPFWDVILPHALASQLSWVDEYVIGLVCGVALFAMPVSLARHEFTLDWHDTKFVDWGTLVLFGGGIALSDAMFKTGLAHWIATSFVGILGSPSTLVMVIAVVFLVNSLTEVTSNAAVTSMLVPIVISIALETGQNPVALAVACAVSASMAFMLPVATPPNALVYGSGNVELKEMIRSGLLLDVVGWGVTVFIVLVVADWMFGVVAF